LTRVRAFVAFAIGVLLTAACTAPVPRPAEPFPPAPSDFPAQRYETAIARGEPIFRIDPARSLIVIEVRRGGSLARLGHDHVVASHDVYGFVAPQERRADLYVPLDRLTVDEPALRAEAGFDTQPSASDVAGTRSNMLVHVLSADRFPFALVSISEVDQRGRDSSATLALALHGTTRTMRIPLQIDPAGAAIAADGRIAMKQSDFGIEPFSILGGAVQVQDEVSLRFRIYASRAGRGVDPS